MKIFQFCEVSAIIHFSGLMYSLLPLAEKAGRAGLTLKTKERGSPLFFLLFLIWLVLNGRVDLEVVLTGAAVSAALTWLARVVLHLPPWGGLRLIRRLPRVFLYLFYLFGQVVVSNLQVMERILFPRKRKGGGRLVWFRTDLKEEGTRLTLANSITLTPGTVTVSLKNNHVCVHALDEDFAKGVKENSFAPRLAHWEEGDHG